jgi:hypothetical protein
MQPKTIFNLAQKQKSFVHGRIRLVKEKGERVLEIQIKPRDSQIQVTQIQVTHNLYLI